ncbi:MAG: CHAD domain-containing protein [Cyclonatronaceae bacterium]
MSAGLLEAIQNQTGKVISLASEYENNPEVAIHEIRKCFKRMRSVAALLKPVNPDSANTWNTLWRDCSRSLSQGRELCVRVNSILALTTKPGQYRSLLDLAISKRNEILNKMSGDGTITRLADTIEKSGNNLATLIPDDLHFYHLEQGLSRAFEKAKNQLDICISSANPGDLHELRKRCKRLQYHTELLSGLDSEIKTLNRSISNSTELLGVYNDMQDLCCWASSSEEIHAFDEWYMLKEQLQIKKNTIRKRALNHILQLLKNDTTDYLELYTDIYHDMNEQ